MNNTTRADRPTNQKEHKMTTTSESVKKVEPRLTGGSDPTMDWPEPGARELAAKVPNRTGAPSFEGAMLPARADYNGVASRAALVDAEVLDRLLARPMWHGHRTPPAVTAAWAQLEPHVDRLLELGDDAAHLDALERQDESEAAQAAYDAVSAGKRPAKLKPVDREAEGKAIRAEAAGTLRHLRQLRRQYDAVVREHAEQWRESLVADFGTLQPAARAAWNVFRGQLGSWQARVQTLAAMNGDIDSEWTPYQSNQQLRALDAVAAGIASIEAYVAQDDANLSGAFVCDRLHTPQPVWWRRERFLGGDPQHIHALGLEEHGEDYAVTRFTGPGGQV